MFSRTGRFIRITAPPPKKGASAYRLIHIGGARCFGDSCWSIVAVKERA